MDGQDQQDIAGMGMAGMGGQYYTEPSEDSLELFEKVLLNTSDQNPKKYPELKSFIPTAYLDENELYALRRVQGLLLHTNFVLESIKKCLKPDKEKKDLNINNFEEFLLRKLFFISFSSKAKNGFTVLELNSQHTYRHENLFQKQSIGGENSNFGEKLKQMMSKAKGTGNKVFPKKESKEIW